MARQTHGNAVETVMEMLIQNGFDGFADVVRILLNEAMKIEREIESCLTSSLPWDTLAAVSIISAANARAFGSSKAIQPQVTQDIRDISTVPL